MKHRIVFWYDGNNEFNEEYGELNLSGVTKIEIDNNQFSVKHRILVEENEIKFLLYFKNDKPEDLDNWLLDVELANAVFSTNPSALTAAEFGRGDEFLGFVDTHKFFFKAQSRKEKLKSLLELNDTLDEIQRKMLVVCGGKVGNPTLSKVVMELFKENASDKKDTIQLIENCNLAEYLWESMKKDFAYKSQTPSVKDFAIRLFESTLANRLIGEGNLNDAAVALLDGIKDNTKYRSSFEVMSNYYQDTYNIEKEFKDRELIDFSDIDYFKAIDIYLLEKLVYQVANKTISLSECDKIIRPRRETYWFNQFEDVYKAIGIGASFIETLKTSDLSIHSFEDGVTKYKTSWYLLDQQYRGFIFHMRKSDHQDLLSPLYELIENLYTNNFVLTVNDNWQGVVDNTNIWEVNGLMRQHDFYDGWVDGFVQKENTLLVIISDALRYEIGVELKNELASEGNFVARIDPILAMLPTYTQLGMACLLPNKEIKVEKDGAVLVDGKPTIGTANRGKILGNTVSESVTIKAEDFTNMSSAETKEYLKGKKVVYLYHNQIDAIGDDIKTEGKVFDATDRAINEIIKILKQYHNHYTHSIVTTDHGFLYQNKKLEKIGFVGNDIDGEEIYTKKRRYAFGKEFKKNPSVKFFQPSDIGIEGDFEIALPKSTNRFRVKGAGSRFVHGGPSLQEIILPVVSIQKSRKVDINKVEISVLKGASNTITTGKFAVNLYQTEPFIDGMQARTIRIGLYSESGELLSNSKEIHFDNRSKVGKDREYKTILSINSLAVKYNRQTVYLKLEEKHDTSKYSEYDSYSYQNRVNSKKDF
jgi:uncharacterized protein (TIGR02687 family)